MFAGFPVSPCLDKFSRDAKEAWRGDIVFTVEFCFVPVGVETLAEKNMAPEYSPGPYFFSLSLSLKWIFSKRERRVFMGLAWILFLSYSDGRR